MPARRGVHQPARKGVGAPKRIRALRLTESDALAIEAATGLALDIALLRIAASCAADPAGARTTLAPLLIEAWDEVEIL